MRPYKTRLVTLPKLRVASSSLVFRSKLEKAAPGFGAAFFCEKIYYELKTRFKVSCLTNGSIRQKEIKHCFPANLYLEIL